MRRLEGGTATVEFVWLTILLLAPFVYVLLAVFDTQRASFAVPRRAGQRRGPISWPPIRHQQSIGRGSRPAWLWATRTSKPTC